MVSSYIDILYLDIIYNIIIVGIHLDGRFLAVGLKCKRPRRFGPIFPLFLFNFLDFSHLIDLISFKIYKITVSIVVTSLHRNFIAIAPLRAVAPEVRSVLV